MKNKLTEEQLQLLRANVNVPLERAYVAARTRKAYWRAAAIPCVQEGISTQVLAKAGLVSVLDLYEHLHLCD